MERQSAATEDPAHAGVVPEVSRKVGEARGGPEVSRAKIGATEPEIYNRR